MDSHQRSENHLFWRRFFFSVTAFSTLYIGAVRPLRVYLNTQVVYPVFTRLAEERAEIFQPTSRSTEIILKDSGDTAAFVIPFGGNFWIPFVLLFIARNWKIIRLLLYFNSALILMYPVLGLLTVWGQGWAIVLLNLLYYMDGGFFLIFVLLAIRSLILRRKLE
jgi:hypothetical protein